MCSGARSFCVSLFRREWARRTDVREFRILDSGYVEIETRISALTFRKQQCWILRFSQHWLRKIWGVTSSRLVQVHVPEKECFAVISDAINLFHLKKIKKKKLSLSMSWRRMVGVETQLHSLLTLTLDAHGWSHLCLVGWFTRMEEPGTLSYEDE